MSTIIQGMLIRRRFLQFSTQKMTVGDVSSITRVSQNKYQSPLVKAQTQINTYVERIVSEEKVSKYREIQATIWQKYMLNQLQRSVLTLNIIKWTHYNQALTTGGEQFQEYPLFKLVQFGIKFIQQQKLKQTTAKQQQEQQQEQEQNQDENTLDTENSTQQSNQQPIQDQNRRRWNKLLYCIRGRMHRCPPADLLRVIYILVGGYKYHFYNRQFILSNLILIKKEIPMVEYQTLKVFYYICNLHCGSNHSKQVYRNQILSQIQSKIHNRVLNKYNSFLNNKKVFHQEQTTDLYEWIALMLTYSRKSKKFCKYTLQLITILNRVYKKTPISLYQNIPLLSVCNLLRLRQVVLLCHRNNEQLSRELNNMRINLLIVHRKQILIEMKTNSTIAHMIFNILLQRVEAGEIPYVRQYLNDEIVSTADMLVNSSPLHSNIYYKLHTILCLLNNNIVDAPFAMKLYELVAKMITQYNLPIVHCLIKISLILSVNLNQQQIMEYLDTHSTAYRHFDWYAYNYAALSLHRLINGQDIDISQDIKQDIRQDMGYDKHQVEQYNIDKSKIIVAKRVLWKIQNDAKHANINSIIAKEIQNEDKKLKGVQIFFAEMRMHELKKLQLIEEPFQRIAHFANYNDKICVFVTKMSKPTKEELLQRNLLNLRGWKVILLDSTTFLELHLEQRMRKINLLLREEQLKLGINKGYLQ